MSITRTISLAMYDKSYAHIRPRLEALGLDALGLDLKVHTFDKTGLLKHGATAKPAAEVDVDYLWLSGPIAADGFQQRAFEIALSMKSVGVLQTYNAGLDDPFYKRLSDKGTRICNSSAQGVAISEYVMAQVLSYVHPVEQQRQLQARREWKITPYRELSQMNWLIIGFGPIGQEVAKRAKAFGATTSVIRRSPAASPLADKIGTMADLGQFAAAADVIVLACQLNASTRGFAGAGFFGEIKPGAILVNVARGALIDDKALIQALDRERLATAILDVFATEPLPKEDPLWAHPKVRLTSHMSFAGSGVRARWDALFLANLQRFAKGEPLAQLFNPNDFA